MDRPEVARAAADWLAASAADRPDRPDPSLYSGLAGIALALVEAREHWGDDRYAAAADRAADAVAAAVGHTDDASLYFGLTGFGCCLRALGRDADADRALDQARALQRADGRWSDRFELLLGNAGIGLGALHAGDLDLALRAVEPYLTSADPTPYGVNWAVRPSPSRSHHTAHGTIGIVHALAAVGAAADRSDLVDLAVVAAHDVMSRNDGGPDGFLVPHSDPQHRPGETERYSYGWCNGPAGDAHTFRLLGSVTGDPTWAAWAARCRRTVERSGVPDRIRPGFWDNHGRCCGTAGVLATACDGVLEDGDDPAYAARLVADLHRRAVVDDTGARWSNHEHRSWLPDLPPEPGWAMGNAGILRELLRHERMASGRPAGYAVDWPGHPPVRTDLGTR